jgi:hypothetical protein
MKRGRKILLIIEQKEDRKFEKRDKKRKGRLRNDNKGRKRRLEKLRKQNKGEREKGRKK